MQFEPLKGIKILDLTAVVVGPVATWRLGQYGAEIIHNWKDQSAAS